MSYQVAFSFLMFLSYKKHILSLFLSVRAIFQESDFLFTFDSRLEAIFLKQKQYYLIIQLFTIKFHFYYFSIFPYTFIVYNLILQVLMKANYFNFYECRLLNQLSQYSLKNFLVKDFDAFHQLSLYIHLLQRSRIQENLNIFNS